MFFDVNTGFACGNNGKILKTTNSGTNWTVTQLGSLDYYSLYIVNINRGYLAGDWSTDGNVKKTTDGGLNWITLNTNTFVTLRSIYSVPQTFGGTLYTAGDNGTLVKTSNGGQNWYVLTTGTNKHIFSIYFTDVNSGYLVGYRSLILKTTDAGMNWFHLYPDCLFQLYDWRSVYFVNNYTGYIAGDCSSKTTNSGTNWFDMGTIWQTSLYFTDINTGFVVGYPYQRSAFIGKTTNGGNNWYGQEIEVNKVLRSVYFVNQYTGWAVGDSGVILKTTNGGEPIGIQPISTNIPEQFCLYQNYPNPFNPATKIRFEVPLNKGGLRGLSVKLIIYDILGHEVVLLVNEQLKPGSYEVEWDGTNFTSGVYFYRLITDDYPETKKMLLIK